MTGNLEIQTGAAARPRKKAAWILLALIASLLVVVVLAGDRRTARLAANTLTLSAMVAALCLPTGAVMAFLLARTDMPGRRPLLLLLCVLLLLPLYLQSAAWQAGFGTTGWLTLARSGPAILQGWAGAVWVHAVAALPWVVLIVMAALVYVPRELEEAALLDGSVAQVFFRVTARRGGVAMGAALLWVLVSTASEMTVTDLFQVRTYAEQIYVDLAIGLEPGERPLEVLGGTALVTACAAAAGVLVLGVEPLVRHGTQQQPLVFELRRWRWPAAIVTALVVAVLLGVPLASLAWKAGVVVHQGPLERTRDWSLAKCATIVAASPLRYQRPLFWSGLLGCLAASTSVAVAAALAWLARGPAARSLPALGAMALALAVPGPLVGLAIIWVFNRDLPGFVWLYDRSIAAPWAALVVRAFPPAMLVIWPAMVSVPREWVEGAAIEGAGAWRTLWRVVVPGRKTALFVGWLVAFAVALGELGASILVVPPGVITLSIEIFNLLHGGYEDEVAGICLAVVLAHLLVAWVVWRRLLSTGAGRLLG